jgi:hypothetical protein
MGEFYVLPVHAAQALGVRVDQVNLPASGYGVDGDALWVDPRFIEVRRSREAIARQMAERRFNVELHRPPRTPEEVKMMKRRERKKLRAAKRKRLAE